VFRTISPSGGDDTATIQAALDSCPKDGVVQLTAGVFHITGQGLQMENSYCALRGEGPGPGTLSVGTPPAGNATNGTYLVKPAGTSYPVVTIGPQWGPTNSANPINFTSDAVKGSKSVTVASTTGLAPGQLVSMDELTDPSISHWNSVQPENDSGWFEEPNRPLGDTMEVASVSGNTVTFTTDFPVTYKVAQSAHLYTLSDQVNFSGVENLYMYGGEGGDGGGGAHIWNCADCWIKHVEDTWSGGESLNIDESFQTEVRDSYFHDSSGGLSNDSGSYGIALSWYTSDSLIENNIIRDFDKVEVMRSAGGGNVFGYNYTDDGADLGGAWTEDGLDGSHMTTPHYELFEGDQAPNADTDDVWGNAADITYFRNDLTGQNTDFPGVGPIRGAGLTQYDFSFSFVGNVLGTPATTASEFTDGYETINQYAANSVWTLCYQHVDNVPDGGKCLATVLRDGNYDYLTHETHWHGIGGTGVNNGLTAPADSTLPDSMYLSSKPAFFGSMPWPWVNGADPSDPVPGRLPAKVRYDAGTPNTLQ
jgi:hypothetical protein